MRQLIFDRLSLAWDEVTLPRPPMLTASPQALGGGRLSSFPTPGQLAAPSVDEVTASEAGLSFPRYGPYFLLGTFGAAKILLLDPERGLDATLRDIAAFVAGCVWHSANDSYLCYDEDSSRVFRSRRPLEKLFFSDQPLGLHCGTISSVLACLLIDRGYACRRGSIRNSGGPNHVFLDVFLPQERRWAFVDADFGVMLEHAGRLLSCDEVVALRNKDDDVDIKIMPLVEKHYTDPKRHFPFTFSGQATWRPEFMSARTVSTDPYYRGVIRNGFKAVEFHELEVVGGAPAVAANPDVPAVEKTPGRTLQLDFTP